MNSLLTKLQHYGAVQFTKFAVAELKLRFYSRLLLGSYSQSKEDLILDRLTGYKKEGLYIDIGAFDPVRFSNTMRFYKRGWRGVNIEPSTAHWERFVCDRPADTNLNVGVGYKAQKLTYYAMDPPTLSTFSKRKMKEYVRSGLRLQSEHKIPVLPLSEILKKYVGHKPIDFMSIDVEGFEMEVLKSNDWKNFRPKYICVESASEDGDTAKTKHIKMTLNRYLTRVGYKFVHDNGLNSFYNNIL